MHESNKKDTQRKEGATLPIHTSTPGFSPHPPQPGKLAPPADAKLIISQLFSLKRENILFIFSSEEAAMVYFHLCFHHRLFHHPEELKLAQRGFRR